MYCITACLFSPAIYLHDRIVHLPFSAGGHSRAGVDVAGRGRPVQLVHDAGVVGAVRAGEGDEAGSPDGASAAGDRDLGTRQIQLSTAGSRGRMKSNVFNAQEVLAVSNATGYLHGDLGFA